MGLKQPSSKSVAGLGFEGLISMASNVDAIVTTTDHQKPDRPLGEIPANSAPASRQNTPTEPAKDSAKFYQGATPRPSAITPTGKWIFATVATLGVIWLFTSVNSPSPSGRSQQSSRQVAPTAAPSWDQLSPSPPLTEDIPPVGTDLSLGAAQIRYCLAEDIRIEGGRGALNAYSESDVNRFNAMVNSYNSRCSKFRYRSGTMESAKTEVERNRASLVAEGRARFAR